VVDVTDEKVFGFAVASSSQTPLVLAVYAAEDAGSNALLTSLAQLVQRAGPALRLAVMEVSELPEVAQQLRIARVPTLFSLYKQRVVSTLLVSPTTGVAELASFVKAAAALSPGGAAEQQVAQQATANTAALVAQGWKAVTVALDATAEKRCLLYTSDAADDYS
jgi:thioredoxin-like negative regulator of GroEL